jgi:MFS family permease
VADYVGWRWVFLGLAPLTAIAAGVAAKGLRRLAPEDGASRDSSQIALALQLAAGTALTLIGVESHSVWTTTLCIVIGVPVGFPALRGLLPAGTLCAAPGTPAAIASLALLTLAFFGAEAFVPLLLTTVRGQPATVVGLALTAATLAWTGGAWLQARLSLRGDRRRLSRGGFALTALGIAGTASALKAEVPVWVVTLSWGAAGLGIGLAYSTLTLVVLERAAKGREGTTATALQLANVVGVALGTGAGGAMLGALTAAGRSQAFAIAGIDLMMVAAVGLGVAATRQLPQRPPAPLAAAEAPPSATPVQTV